MVMCCYINANYGYKVNAAKQVIWQSEYSLHMNTVLVQSMHSIICSRMFVQKRGIKFLL